MTEEPPPRPTPPPPARPRRPEPGEPFRLRGGTTIYVRDNAGTIRRATPKQKGKAARKFDKQMRRASRPQDRS